MAYSTTRLTLFFAVFAAAASIAMAAVFGYPTPVIERADRDKIAVQTATVPITYFGREMSLPFSDVEVWARWMHFYLRLVNPDGSTGQWIVCLDANGCRYSSGSSDSATLKVDGSRWLGTAGSKLQMRFWMGLGDPEASDPKEGPSLVSHWSNVWTILIVEPGVGFIPWNPGPKKTVPPGITDTLSDRPVESMGPMRLVQITCSLTPLLTGPAEDQLVIRGQGASARGGQTFFTNASPLSRNGRKWLALNLGDATVWVDADCVSG